MTGDRLSRRTVLRGLGMLGAVSISGASAFSHPVVATSDSSDGTVSSEDRTITSFDGVELATTVFEPDGEGPFPSVLITHGWGNTRKSDAVTGLAKMYASHGYVVLTYDSRGFGYSEGLVSVDGENEIRDAQRLISYLAAQEIVENDGENDPVVGMDGFSYGAGIQLRTAAADDRLDAIIPRWAWNDLRFSNDPNDVIKWPWFYALYLSGISGSLLDDYKNDKVPDLDPEFIELSKDALETGEAPAKLRDYWAAKSPGPQDELADIETPTLLIHGWYDRLFTPNETFANYRGLRENDGEARLVLYNGGHNLVNAPGDDDPNQLKFLRDAALRWFRRHLKGEPVPHGQRLAPVTMYRDATERFESYNSLPDGEETVSLRDALGSGSTTLTPAGSDGPTSASFDFDITKRVDLAGSTSVSLNVSPGGDVGILSGALQRIPRDGGKANTLKNQVSVIRTDRPGKVRLDLNGVEAKLEPGDTLRLVLAVDDAELAPNLSPNRFPSPGSLPGISADAPVTTGLYFDSPSAVTIHHRRRGESTMTLSTVEQSSHGRGIGASGSQGRGKGRNHSQKKGHND